MQRERVPPQKEKERKKERAISKYCNWTDKLKTLCPRHRLYVLRIACGNIKTYHVTVQCSYQINITPINTQKQTITPRYV